MHPVHRAICASPTAKQEAYPFPCTLFLIDHALKRLRLTKRQSATNHDSIAQLPGSLGLETSEDDDVRLRAGRKESSVGDTGPQAGRAWHAAPLEVEVPNPAANDKKQLMLLRVLRSLSASWRRLSLLGNQEPHAEQEGSVTAKEEQTYLWRGMRDVNTDVGGGASGFEMFQRRGGSVLSPWSASQDEKIAVRYAARGHSGQSLIFRIAVRSLLEAGGDLKFLSAFPHEEELLFPPLTFFFRAEKDAQELRWNGVTYTILDVEPRFPGS